MSETMIRVEVAADQTVLISPHPSGIAELGPLYLYAGQHSKVTAARAEALYAAGKVLHPVTGQPRPAQIAGTPPLVSMGSESWASLAARADAERVLEPVRAPRSSAVDGWRDHVNIEPHDPNTTEQIINVGERRWQW